MTARSSASGFVKLMFVYIEFNICSNVQMEQELVGINQYYGELMSLTQGHNTAPRVDI